jgi:hypothetical protein
MSRRAGWPCSLAQDEGEIFRVNVGAHRLVFAHADSPDNVLHSEPNAIRLPAPWDLAAQQFVAASGCTGGHFAVLAPVGGYASALAAGGIDAVVVEPTDRFGLNRPAWTRSYASISHGRCWLLNVAGFGTSITDDDQLARTLTSTGCFVVPAKWKQIRDTATLCEHARDCGRSDGRFPEIVVMAADLLCRPAGPVIAGWLAFTDALVSVALAEAIGAVVAPERTEESRFQQLRSTLCSDVRGWL